MFVNHIGLDLIKEGVGQREKEIKGLVLMGKDQGLIAAMDVEYTWILWQEKNIVNLGC